MLVRQERERRKVQISGKSSCMVALPKRWVRDMGLHQGSEVTIARLNATSLLVNAQPEESSRGGREAEIEVKSEEPAETVFRSVVSLYVLGFTRMTVEAPRGSFSQSKKLALKELVRRHLIGTEAIAETRDRMTVHVLLGFSELSVEDALKKMLLIIDTLHKDAIQALRTSDRSYAEVISERQDEVGRFGLYVIRQLNLSLSQGVLPDLSLENRDTLGYILIARILERIAHHVGDLTAAAVRVGSPLPKQTTEQLATLTNEACGLVDDALLSLFKRDHRGANAVIEKAKSIVGLETELLKSTSETEGQAYFALHMLTSPQRRVAEYAREVAEIVLDMTVERTLRKREDRIPEVVYA